MGKPESEVLREARRKKRLGQKLSEKELKALRDYANDRSKLAVKVYLSSEQEMEDMKWGAKQDGYSSVSKWMLEKTKQGASGKVYEDGYIERLKDEIDKLESALQVSQRDLFTYKARADMYEKKFLGVIQAQFEMSQQLKEAMQDLQDAVAEKRGKTVKTRQEG